MAKRKPHNLHLLISNITLKKTSLTFAFWQDFRGQDMEKYVAKFTSIKRALQTILGGANLPYLGKQSDY